MQVKANQKVLLRNCERITKAYVPCDMHKIKEKGHGRIETRKVKIFPFAKTTSSLDKTWQRYVQAVIYVDRTRKTYNHKEKTWKITQEKSFYVSTIPLAAKDALQAIRSHWSIENSNHHVRDTRLNEDASRIRKNPHIIAKLRSTALNIFNAKGTTNISRQLYENCLDIHAFMKNYKHLLVQN